MSAASRNGWKTTSFKADKYKKLQISRDRLLIYIEDPGAANFVAPMMGALSESGWDVTLTASGPAVGFLEDRGIQAEILSPEMPFGAYFKEMSPDILLVGTSENVETPAFEMISAAKDAGIRTVAVIDSPANAEHRFRGNGSDPLKHAPQWLLVPDDWTRKEYIKLGFSSDRVMVTGHPRFDLLREEAARLKEKGAGHFRQKVFPKAPLDRKVVVFLSELSSGLGDSTYHRGPDYTLHGWGGSDRRTDIVLEEFIDAVCALEEKPYVVLRLHPKDDLGSYREYVDFFDELSLDGVPLPLLLSSDLVVGMSTSLLDDAAILGLSALSILPREVEKDYSMTVRSGFIPYVTDRQELHDILPEILNRSKKAAKQIDVAEFCCATDKVTNALMQVKNGRSR